MAQAHGWARAGLMSILVLAGGAGLAAAVGPLPTLVALLEPVAAVETAGGGGLWIKDGYAYMSGLNRGFGVVDVRDPENPVHVGQLGIYTRDADVLEVGGRLYAVASSGGPMRIIDVEDPTNPTLVATVNVPSHNLASVPGSSLVYNSRGGGGGSGIRIEIVDAAVPSAPVVVKTWVSPSSVNGKPVRSSSCHDIAVDAAADRAYCAGGRQTAILDISDRLEPVLLGVIDNEYVAYHHWAFANADNSILILGDEDFNSGSSFHQMENCQLSTPVVTASLPMGALWFYDIQDPANPVLLSWVSPMKMSSGTCTVHFGEIIPGTNLLAASWYRGGITLIDFTVPVAPRILDTHYQNVNAWDVRYWDGHLVTGDISRGMEVLRINDPLALP